MSLDSIERFVGRLITDDAFRGNGVESIHRACMEGAFLVSRNLYYEIF